MLIKVRTFVWMNFEMTFVDVTVINRYMIWGISDFFERDLLSLVNYYHNPTVVVITSLRRRDAGRFRIVNL